MLQLKAPPAEGAANAEIINYIAYLSRQVQFLSDTYGDAITALKNTIAAYSAQTGG